MVELLKTRYLGLDLSSPIIVGSCPLTIESEAVRQMVGAGAGAIVLPSVLKEQIVHAKLKETDPLRAIEESGYQPQQDKYNGGVEHYLDTIRHLKSGQSVPVIASMNGGVTGDWIEYAKGIENAGADALELNWQPMLTSPGEPAASIEEKLCALVRDLTGMLQIPVAVKLSQRFTNLASVAHQLQHAGAAGLILFTHLPRWDVSVERMHWTCRWELSPLDSLGGILEGIVRARTGGLEIPIAASGGVRSAEHAIKAMIAGADAVMVTSEVYREGPDVIRKMVDGLTRFIENSRHDTLEHFLESRPEVELGPERLMRLEYVDPLTRSTHYPDPTPIPASDVGDASGHRR
ncbi:dihydroorotate dehydrogenase-like protein [Roseiconus nitratireducens]|uniref:Dihydroorotate dehydrogenase-like protein n=1 Tax=Roseiconus nitratireducens TaxID=2605748 RepID=A0A5M6D698_9BACT|nr:dihydroorotate dehydrogenase-like protein [Roseiconus nitratireducens]KAA5543057.1 dihydroorotate dehydrogenase-like protein [Roseiconus nitratireducens]